MNLYGYFNNPKELNGFLNLKTQQGGYLHMYNIAIKKLINNLHDFIDWANGSSNICYTFFADYSDTEIAEMLNILMDNPIVLRIPINTKI